MGQQNLERFGSLFDLSGRVAVVTGAARGNGLGIANALRDAGATVIGLDRAWTEETSPNPEENLYDEIDRRTMDITNEAQVQEVFAKIVADYGALDILVNNAGVSFGRMEVDVMDMEKFQTTFQVNVMGSFICTKTAAPYMKEKRWGRIVNISSTSGFLRTKGAGAYSTSKSSLSHLTRLWGTELAPYNINVNALVPSFVMTPMSKKTMQLRAESSGRTFEDVQEETLDTIPLHRFVRVEDVANWVVLLCSGLADMTTATNFSLSGGVTQL